MFKRFLHNTSGNIAIIFSISLVALFGVAGLAVDFVSMSQQHKKFQIFADAAVLSAVLSGKQEIAALQEIAEKTVAANNASGKVLTVETQILEGNVLQVNVSAQHETFFMRFFSASNTKISAIAQAPPKSGLLNLAMVLDVTRSMEGTKLATLKTAANNLVDEITQNPNSPAMISVVPFAQYVSLPLSYKTAYWIDVEPAGNHCYDRLNEANSTNCRQVGSGENQTTQCDAYVYDNICTWNEWTGCMGSRAAPWNSTAEYALQKLQGFTTGDYCSADTTMQPLTSNIEDVKSRISSLQAGRETYIPSGLLWGWRTLTPEAPLIEADTSDKDKRSKALLLMTDGENVRSLQGTGTFGGVFHWGTDTTGTNTLVSQLCENIKSDGISIYTVAFDVADEAIKTILRSCASSPDKFFDAGNPEALTAAFKKVGDSLAQVRLSK